MNGIIENYLELRSELQDLGVVFRSDTDTEVVPHLIAREYRGDLAAAVREVLPAPRRPLRLRRRPRRRARAPGGRRAASARW